MRWLVFAVAATSFQALPLNAMTMNPTAAGISGAGIPTESYLRVGTASKLLTAHILFMLLSWVGVLPICIMLKIAGSNLRYPCHVAFLGLHGTGSLLALAYRSRTPDLYPGNSHARLGWVLTILVFAHSIVGVLRSLTKHRRRDMPYELTPFMSSETLEGAPGPRHVHRMSSPGTTSPCPRRSDCSTEGTDSDTLFDVLIATTYASRLKHRFKVSRIKAGGPHWLNIPESRLIIQLVDLGYDYVLRSLLILGSVAICTGIVTMTGIFHDKHIFNGLAHTIKGGVFFWYGILTLGRWKGCFSTRGWAWNLQPLGRKHNSVSMESLECTLILLYGVTNVFLEHLTAWGEAWTAMDFEHVAVSLLFIGGGLCGLMVEMKPFQTIFEADAHGLDLDNEDFRKRADDQRRIPVNPVPAMIIFLLGLILAGHHQSSMEATQMHQQVGNLFTGASGARCVTYLLQYISPALSVYPSRPPSELICSLCLMCGGVMLMASNRDTVQSMIDNNIHAMLVWTITLGEVAMLMAWIIFVLGVKDWAAAREERRRKKSLPRA